MSVHVNAHDARIHAIWRSGQRSGPPLVLLHGLTANAHSWDGLIDAGLADRETVAIDLRGRGQSDQPATGYAMANHAADVLAVLDHLGHRRAVVCGHSYGGLLAVYLAAVHPQRVAGLIVLDIAGPTIHDPGVMELIRPSLERLGRVWPSLEEFLATMRRGPALAGYWDRAVEAFYRADVTELGDGRVQVRPRADSIQQVIAEGRREDWAAHLAGVAGPVLYLHARGSFGAPGARPMITDDHARATADVLPDCRYEIVPGNHLTMMFGDGALAVAAAIDDYLRTEPRGTG